MVRRPVISLWLALVAIFGAGCGAPTDDNPRALDAADVPFDLLGANPSTTTTTSESGKSSEITVYFIGPDDRLVGVPRSVSSPASVEKVLRKLVAGPTEEERSRGLVTLINPASTVLTAPVENGIATVDISGAYFIGPGEDQIKALAQTVYTSTFLGGVVGIRFLLDGQPANVPIDKGAQTSLPVGKAAYAKYAPQ